MLRFGGNKRVLVRHFGALTSKPYAFVARPWELKTVETIDAMDGMGANIKLQTKGNELVRVLPRTNDEINEEWIHDKTRYSYDGLKRQRLIRPLVRDVENPTKWDENASQWRDAFNRINQVINTKKSKNGGSLKMKAICGPTVDLYSAAALSQFSASLADCQLETAGSSGSTLGRDIASQYRFNTTIQNLEDADFCLLVGINVDAEAPLVLTRLRKAFLRDQLKVVSCGPSANLNFPYQQIGSTADVLVQVAEGRHPVCAEIASAKKPIIIVGEHVFEREDGKTLAAAIESMAENSGSLRQYDDNGKLVWNGVNVVHHNANDVGLLDLGQAAPFKVDDDEEKPDVLYLMGVTPQDLPVPLDQITGKDTFVIVQSSHGDELASKADVVLPGAAYSEKNGVFINFEGRAQKGRNALTPPLDAREDWKIIRALSEVVDASPTLPYTSEKEIHDKVVRLVPTLEHRNKVSPASSPSKLIGDSYLPLATNVFGKGVVYPTPFRPALYDFYLDGNAVSQSSLTMAKTSKEFGCKKNFVEHPY